MTEEIIIDGVNVAGCRNYKHNVENIGWSSCLSKDEEHYHSNNPLCCEKKDCYYKQLKRLEQEHNTICYNLGLLEQENENLKKEVKQIGSDFIKKGDYARELEQERDELKFENDRYKQLLKGCPTEDEDCGFCVIDKQNKELKETVKDLNQSIQNCNIQRTKMYKVLEEIREYLNNVKELRELYLKAGEPLKLLNIEDGYSTLIKALNWVLEDSEVRE